MIDQDNADQGKSCELMDGFAVFVQLTLALTALAALVVKRWREKPRRPVPIWMMDVSKQFIGASVVHFLNVGLSYTAGRPVHGSRTNLCVVYLLSLLVDTTIGIAILWSWLRMIELLLERCGIRNVRSGHYGPPPLRCMLQRWARQTSVFVLATICMKLCIFLVFHIAPALFLLGDWLLEHVARGNLRYQVVFVMFLFPLFMNAFQFCVIDTFIKLEKKHCHSREKNYMLPPPAVLDNSATSTATATATTTETTPLLSM